MKWENILRVMQSLHYDKDLTCQKGKVHDNSPQFHSVVLADKTDFTVPHLLQLRLTHVELSVNVLHVFKNTLHLRSVDQSTTNKRLG